MRLKLETILLIYVTHLKKTLTKLPVTFFFFSTCSVASKARFFEDASRQSGRLVLPISFCLVIFWKCIKLIG